MTTASASARTPCPKPRIDTIVGGLAITDDVRARTSRDSAYSLDGEAGYGGALAAASVAVALAMLAVAVWFDGAFAVREWAPPAIFALVVLALAPKGRPRGAAPVV